MASLWLFIVIGSVIGFFWYSRKIAEAASEHAQRQAKQLQVQLLSVACKKVLPGILKNGRLGIKSQFLFEFSSDGESLYQGYLYLENEKLVQVDIPPHRLG